MIRAGLRPASATCTHTCCTVQTQMLTASRSKAGTRGRSAALGHDPQASPTRSGQEANGVEFYEWMWSPVAWGRVLAGCSCCALVSPPSNGDPNGNCPPGAGVSAAGRPHTRSRARRTPAPSSVRTASSGRVALSRSDAHTRTEIHPLALLAGDC